MILIAMTADMVELMDHYGAVLMALIGDAPEMRDHSIVFMQEIGTDQLAGAVGRHGSTTIIAAPPRARSR